MSLVRKGRSLSERLGKISFRKVFSEDVNSNSKGVESNKKWGVVGPIRPVNDYVNTISVVPGYTTSLLTSMLTKKSSGVRSTGDGGSTFETTMRTDK